MINLSDPLERLRAANPVPADQVARLHPDMVLFHRITTDAPALRPAPARRRARRLVPALLLTSLIGGAAAYALLRDGVTKPQTVACHELVDERSNTEVVVVDERGPIAACADLWRTGVLGSGSDVPALVECVLGSGVAGVFPTVPGEDVCARLNLPPAATPPPAVSAPTTLAVAPAAGNLNARILQFREVVGQFLDAPCVEPGAAAAGVRRELDLAGLSDWTVRGGEGLAADGYSPARPCATLALLPESKEVRLIPAPARPER